MNARPALRLAPDHGEAVQAAVARVIDAAMRLRLQNDTDALRRQLTATRDAILDAGDTINRAEDETRNNALAALS